MKPKERIPLHDHSDDNSGGFIDDTNRQVVTGTTTTTSSGGAALLNDLADVDTVSTPPVDNDVLTYNSTTGMWDAEASAAASYATPAIVLGTAAAAGAASSSIRSDSTIVAFDATTPATQAFGDAGTVGVAAVSARRDHKHVMPTAAVTTSGLTQATARILGRTTASTGAIEEITVGSGLSLSAGSLTATGGGSGTLTTIEEVDGSPTDSAVTKLVFPNGTLAIVSHVATYTPTGGGSGNLTAPASVSVDLGASNALTRQAATNTEDDLFDSSPLNVKWLTYTGYNAVTDLTAKPGWCKITTAGAKLQAVPAGDWTIEAEVIAAPTTSAVFTTGGLVLTTGTTQASATEARLSIGFTNSADLTRVFFEKFVNGAFSATYRQDTTTSGGMLPSIMRIIKSGTTYTVQFGPTREGLQYFTNTASLGLVPTHFGFHGDIGVYVNGFYRL